MNAKRGMMNSESKIKNIWLCLTAIVLIIIPRLVSDISELSSLDKSISIITSVIGFYVFYYCSYKNAGTGLLTFNLILFPINYIILIWVISHSETSFKKMGNLTLNNWYDYLRELITITWYIYSYKLLQVNKKFQFQSLISSENYIKAKEFFHSAETIEDLNKKFGSLLRANSGGDLSKEEHIIAAYKIRKKILKLEGKV